MKTEIQDRQSLVAEIIATDEAQRRRMYRIVERKMLIGTDGKEYAHSMPWGVEYAKTGDSYWVFQSVSQGTTHGKRYTTKAEAEAEFEKYATRESASFAAELEKMTDARFADQVKYWLKRQI